MAVDTVLSHLSGRQVEAFYVLLVSSGKFTVLPELYDIFGREMTLKFLDTFAGCSIKVPSPERLKDLALKVEVYVRLSRVPEAQRESVAEEIAEREDCKVAYILSLFEKTKSKMEDELHFNVISRRR